MTRLLTAAGIFAGLLVAPFAHAQADNQAQQIFVLTNQDRAAHGLPPLEWNDALAVAAAKHLDRMTQERNLSHQYPGEPGVPERAAQAGAHFRAVAENIAMGYSPSAIEKEWMHSTPHRTNILDPEMNAIGIAVTERGGYDYAVEDFANTVQERTRAQVEQQVGALLRAQNIDPDGSHDLAEAACQTNNNVPAGSKVKSIVRFETPDLTHLPSQIVGVLHSGHYTSAAVGACQPQGPQSNFTTYRVAILFY